MASDFVNTKSMLSRQFGAPGSRWILLLAFIMFAPRAWDLACGEPWIDNSLSVIQTTDGRWLIEDTVITKAMVYGDRQIVLENAKGDTMCSSKWAGAWTATTRKNWELKALAGVNCQFPKEAFRVCSSFSVYSQSGRHRAFGPSCSPLTNVSENLQRKDR